MMKSHAGMSIIELITAMGIGAVMLAALGFLASNTLGMFDHADKAANVNDTTEALRATLYSKVQCSNNFKNTPLTMADAANGIPFTKISSFDATNAVNSSLVETGKDYRGVKVDSILLRPVAQTDTALFVANIEVTFSKSSGIKAGFSNFVRVVPVFVRTFSGKVVDCWSKKEQQGTLVEASIVCQVASNGVKTSYDPVSKTCVPEKGEWYTGSLTSASCPAGHKLPAGAGAFSNCRGNPVGANWVDPTASVPVVMADGSVTYSTRAPIIQNLVNGVCTCAWADDLPASSLVGATCDIYCVSN
jgi:hypothetical protein